MTVWQVRELGIPPENRQVPPDGKKDWNAYLCQVKGISEELKKNPDAVLHQAFFKSVTSGYSERFSTVKELFRNSAGNATRQSGECAESCGNFV